MTRQDAESTWSESGLLGDADAVLDHGGGSGARQATGLYGGVYGPAVSASAQQGVVDRLAAYKRTAKQRRVLGEGDICVAAEACGLGVPVLTSGKGLFTTMIALGMEAERLG